MKQLVTISFAIKNVKEERNKIIKYMNYYFSIPIQETYNLLHTQYSAKRGKWRSYLQFEVLTADYVVKWIKRRIDSKSSPHFTIEIKSDTEVTFKVHKKVQFNQ